MLSFTDEQGNVFLSASAGQQGFKGARKSTPYAAQVVATIVGEKAMELGIREVDILVKGPGVGRESAMRSLQALGLLIKSIRDVTPIPHNGSRARKRRRV